MPELKQFIVSCFNQTTDKSIYENEPVRAFDSMQAKSIANEIHEEKLLNLPSDTVRRYVITPVEEGDGSC